MRSFAGPALATFAALATMVAEAPAQRPAPQEPAAGAATGAPTAAVRVEDIVGQPLYGASRQEVGRIEDVVLDRATGEPAVVVDYGGKLIVVPAAFVAIENNRLVTDMSDDELASADELDTTPSGDADDTESIEDEMDSETPNSQR